MVARSMFVCWCSVSSPFSVCVFVRMRGDVLADDSTVWWWWMSMG